MFLRRTVRLTSFQGLVPAADMTHGNVIDRFGSIGNPQAAIARAL